MAKLYELADSYERLLEMIEDETVSLEDIQDTLESIEDLAELKIENIAKIIKMTEGNIEIFKAEEKRLANQRKSMENKVKSLKDYLLISLDKMKKDKVEAGLFKVRKQKNPDSVVVLNPHELPDEFKIPQEPKIDMTSLKSAVLKEGREINGVEKAPVSYHIRIQ